jgi:type IV pilus assembly protein PilF
VDPRLPSAHNGIAILYEKLGELNLADKHYRKAIQLDAKDARALNNYGTFLCRTGKYKESEQYFERAASNPLYKQPASALKNAGICALKDNDPDKAESFFRKSLEVNPAYAPSLLQMAKLSYAADDYLKARAYVQRYLQIAEPTPETLWLAVRTERELGDANAAASYALLLRSRFPDSPQTQQLERSDDGERSATQ